MVSFYEEGTFEALATTGAKALKWPEMLIRKIEKPAGHGEGTRDEAQSGGKEQTWLLTDNVKKYFIPPTFRIINTTVSLLFLSPFVTLPLWLLPPPLAEPQ